MTNQEALNPDQILASMTPQIYARFQEAIALGKWPNGVALSQAQKHTCMQAVIVYENAHIAKEQRTGFVPPKEQPCADDSHIHTIEQPLQWK